MPFIPVSLVIHLALTSIASVTWAAVTLRLFGIKHPAARSLILASSLLLPVGGFVAHLIYPHTCTGRISFSIHFACLASSALGDAGTVLLMSSLTVAVSQALVTLAVQSRVVRRSVPLEAYDWQDDQVEARVRLAIERITGKGSVRPTIRVTCRAGICCTVGSVRPIVLISEDLCRSLDLSELEAALAHEMAHVSRHDNGIGLASALFKALTFFSPAAYVGIRLYMDEREKAADDIAVRITGDRLALASAIVKVARAGSMRPTHALANAAGAGRVTERVQRLLDGASELRQAKLPFVLTSVTGLVLITLYVC